MDVLETTELIMDYEFMFGDGSFTEDFGAPLSFPRGDLRKVYREFLDQAAIAIEQGHRAVGGVM